MRYAEAAAFLARAEEWLLRDEAEHNLILGITGSLRDGTGTYDPPFYLATVERGGEIVGCAFRTPPYKLGLTRMPADAARAVAADLALLFDELPSVLGPEASALAFADAWAAHKGVTPRVGEHNRIYQLDRVADDLPYVSGAMRTARLDDIDLIMRWVEAFQTEVRLPTRLSKRAFRNRIANGGYSLWDNDGRTVSLAGSGGPTRHGSRIGPVFTPAELRGRGYATALVAALSRHLLAGGRRFCFLYTDLANPTSNSIYQRIGYRPVADAVDVVFEKA